MSQEPQHQLLAGKRCLVLEDEFLITLDLEEILQALGASEIVRANQVATALAAVENGQAFDFAVLDVRLNEETSLPVARALTSRSTPFVFITGAAQPSADFAHIPVVAKPYDHSSVIAAIARAIKAR